jgi:hypothetical protein
MDLVDFNYELGEASGGNRIFPSEAEVLEHQECSAKCGIVEVEVRLIRVVRKPIAEPGDIS